MRLHEPHPDESSYHPTVDRLGLALDEAIPDGSEPVWVRVMDTGVSTPASLARRLWIGPSRPGATDTTPGSGHGSAEVTIEIDDDPGRLIGWTAPTACTAVAVVAGGRGRALDDSSVHHGPVRVVVVVDRSGAVSGRTRVGTGPVIVEQPGGGRLLDALQRSLGLPTAPPPLPCQTFIDRMWLGAVVSATQDRAVLLGWEQVRHLHPAVSVLVSLGFTVTPDVVDTALRMAPEAWSWESIRQQAAEGELGTDLLDPAVADWMDSGMFARSVLEATRTCSELLAEAAPGLSVSAERRLRRAIRLPAE